MVHRRKRSNPKRAKRRNPRSASGRFVSRRAKSRMASPKRRRRHNPRKKAAAPAKTFASVEGEMYGPLAPRSVQRKRGRAAQYRRGGKIVSRSLPRRRRRRRSAKSAVRRARRSTKRSAAPRRKRRVIRRRRMARGVAALSRNLARVERALRAGGRKRKGGSRRRRRVTPTRRINLARRAGLRARLYVAKMRPGKRRTKARRMLRKHRLARVNFSMKGLFNEVKMFVPGVVMAAAAGIGVSILMEKYGQKYLDMALAKVAPSLVGNKYLPAVGVGVGAIAVFAALRLSKNSMAMKASVPVLTGGLSLAATMALTPAIRKAAGLGEYVAMGEYVGVGNASLNVGGANLRLNGMGEYVGVSGGGGIFGHDTTGSLGASIDPQLYEGREGDRGTQGEPRVVEFVDGGSLSGDIFS